MRTTQKVSLCVALLCGCVLVGGCPEGGDNNANGNGGTGGTDNTGPAVVIGRVSTVDGAPVANAAVTLSVGRSSTTDDNGFFSFEGFDSGEVVVARVAAEGFAGTSLSIPVIDRDRAAPICVFLSQAGETVMIDADTGTTQREGDSAVTLPAGALVDANGNAVNGDVELTTTFIDPSSEGVLAFPGSFDDAMDTAGSGVTLESYGFAIYELSQDGEPVNLAPGQTATIEYVLPDNAQADFVMGDTIPLWEFDDDTAMWMEAGTGEIRMATDGSGRLAWFAEVDHFSAWNCDAPVEEKHGVRGRIVIQNDDGSTSPVSGAEVTLVGESYNGTSMTRSDTDGTFCADAKRGSDVRLEVRINGDATPVFTERVTLADTSEPCAAGLDVGDITISFDACVSGQVTNSDGTPASGVKVYIVPGETVTTDSSGNYCGAAAANADVSVFAEGRPSVMVRTEASGACGGTCVEANLDFTLPSDGDRVGFLQASESEVIDPTFGNSAQFVMSGVFLTVDAETAAAEGAFTFPGFESTTEEIGACTLTTQRIEFDIDGTDPTAFDGFGGIGALDPGDPGLASNGSSTAQLLRGNPNDADPPQPVFSGLFSPDPNDFERINSNFSAGDTVTFTFPGGADIGAFEGSIRVPTSFNVTMPDLSDPDLVINTGAALPLRWDSDAAADLIFVTVVATDTNFTTSGGVSESTIIQCEFPDTGSATVPSAAMARLPADANSTGLTISRLTTTEIDVPLNRINGTGIVELSGGVSVSRFITGSFEIPDIDIPDGDLPDGDLPDGDIPDLSDFCSLIECPAGTVCNPETFSCDPE